MAPITNVDFGPHAQILKTLLPRSRGAYLYNPDGELLWSSAGADLHDLRPVIEELLESAKAPGSSVTGLHRLLDDAPAYAFLLRDEAGAVLGVTAIVCRAATRDGDVPTFESVERTLAPLLVLTQRDLGQQRIIETGRFQISDTQELEWLLDVGAGDPAASGGDALQALLEAYALHAECDAVFLHVPARRLERRVERSALAAAERETLRDVVGRHLYKVAQLQQKTLLVNKVRETGAGGLVPFRILCVPLVRRGRTLGVAVALNRAAGRAFGDREARMLERAAPRLLEILDVRIDGTTGLPTRHAFDEQAAALLAGPARGERAVVCADVDGLGLVNDLHGFEAGDALLRAVGDAWRALPLPGASLIARLASDRFVALLDGVRADGARTWAESARHAAGSLRLAAPLEGQPVSLSLGIAPLAPGGSLEHALAAAEAACKLAKGRGRNRVELHLADPAEIERRQQELRVFHELLEAFEHGRLRLYAQPLAPLWDPSRAPRHEVLVRLQDAHGRLLRAEDFIGIARRHQLLDRVDDWVLGELVRRLAPQAAALEALGTVFSVNLSVQSLRRPDLAERIAAALRAAHVPPALLSFEISEEAVMALGAEAERFVAAIAAIGCGTSIDDFGTGATSLALLKALPVTALKIDGLFVRDLLTEPRSESLVRAILQIARQLELDTVAECVESRETAAHLATLGVTYGQGLALGEPRPLPELLAELAPAAPASPAPAQAPAAAGEEPDPRVH
ncbi:MAG: bifunctional diguanylate cyclase/phosphodiesterase [Proteobacteria bacterium]|nr:bifunctional diguanylate cyclase/phosphodiesterase [Pseudomonadota bacterium]